MSVGVATVLVLTAAAAHPHTVLRDDLVDLDNLRITQPETEDNNLVDLVNVRITQPQTEDNNLIDLVNVRITQPETEDNVVFLSNNFEDPERVPTLGSAESTENEDLNMYDDIFEEEKDTKKAIASSIFENTKEKSESSEALSEFVNVRIPVSIAILDFTSDNEDIVIVAGDDHEYEVMTTENDDEDTVTEKAIETTITDEEDETIEKYNPCVSVNAAHFGKTLQRSFPLEDPWRVIPPKFTIKECWQECQKNQECKFWNFVDETYGGIMPERFIGSCYLKSGRVKEPKPIKGYVAGTRECAPQDSQ